MKAWPCFDAYRSLFFGLRANLVEVVAHDRVLAVEALGFELLQKPRGADVRILLDDRLDEVAVRIELRRAWRLRGELDRRCIRVDRP